MMLSVNGNLMDDLISKPFTAIGGRVDTPICCHSLLFSSPLESTDINEMVDFGNDPLNYECTGWAVLVFSSSGHNLRFLDSICVWFSTGNEQCEILKPFFCKLCRHAPLCFTETLTSSFLIYPNIYSKYLFN